MSVWRKCGARLAPVALSLLVLAGLDRLAGVLYKRITPETGRAAVDSMLGVTDSLLTGAVMPHPYLYYVNRPHYRALGHVQFNALGYRNAEMRQEPDAGVVRILASGGSTTLGYPYVADRREAWPAQLEGLLTERAGCTVEVVNAGLDSATSAELLAHYVFRDRYLKSQIVVIHEGGNDGLPMLRDHYNPEYTHWSTGWRNPPLAPRPGEGVLLRRSWLARTAYAWWMSGTRLDVTIGRKPIHEVYRPEECLHNAEVNEPVGFRRNLDLLVRTILADGATPVLFAWVSSERRLRDGKALAPYADAMLLTYRKNHAVMQEISAKYHVPLLELPPGSLDDSLFIDFCHLGPAGERIKAEFLARALLPLAQEKAADLASTRR